MNTGYRILTGIFKNNKKTGNKLTLRHIYYIIYYNININRDILKSVPLKEGGL